MESPLSDPYQLQLVLTEVLREAGLQQASQLLKDGEFWVDYIGEDFGGDELHSIRVEVSPQGYGAVFNDVEEIESQIVRAASALLKPYSGHAIAKVAVVPSMRVSITIPPSAGLDWEHLKRLLLAQRDLMISVATGGPRINTVNQEYIDRRREILTILTAAGITHTNPHDDLWAWYGRWSSGDLPTWQSRREYVKDLFAPLLKALEAAAQGNTFAYVAEEPTGWKKVDRLVGEIRHRLASANTETDFQSVGFMCREVHIDLAQAVYQADVHEQYCDQSPSETDARRMIDAYLQHVLPGSSNESMRRFAKSANQLANDLTHRRTADFRDAAVCVNATTALINTIAVLSERHTEQPDELSGHEQDAQPI